MIDDVHDHQLDSIDGVLTPPLVVEGAYTLQGTRNGSTCVHAGAVLTILGTTNGSIAIRRGGRVHVLGTHNGSMYVSDGATLRIDGLQQGSTYVSPGGHTRIEPSGRLAGSIYNDGVIDNYGQRGGPVAGSGTLTDHAGSSVKQPVVRDGTSYYQW